MTHRIAQRVAGAALVALLLAGATGCRAGQDDNSGSSGTQQHNTSGSKLKETCLKYRVALNDLKPTKAERKLPRDARLKASYKSTQTFYAAFAQIFPESAKTANALSTIYAHAYNGTLTNAEEAKIGGLDDKINKVIDSHCPNSGFPAN